jgi:hypothetical protein
MKTQAGQILLIEDNSNDLELALHAFESRPLANAIEVARDGQEALELDRFVEAAQTLGMYWLLLNEPPANVHAES